PKILVLDEPTAGLDPRGRDEILGEIQKLYQKGGITIILVSHSMEDVAKLVDRILVMHKGKLQMDGSTREIFRKAEELESLGLGIPQITKFMKKFKEKGNDVKDDVLTVDEAKEEILKFLRRKEDA
ncbi:MAG TPA: energy-coupling factor ABC transporter ATP-binding protein, partial [Tissierella sp.]|nr:energy-coupling factor ABC transporter ATP-binding protein [Tissierella sp.]